MPLCDRTTAERRSERREHRSEVRQAIHKDLRDRVEAVEAGFGQLKERIAERQAERETPSE